VHGLSKTSAFPFLNIKIMLSHHIEELKRDLDGLLVHEQTSDALADAIHQTFQSGGKLLTCGNGGSSAEAAHLAEEFTGRFYRERPSQPGLCLSIDGTLLTCIANDYGFDQVFSRQIESLGKPGDVMVAFTTSGNSENIVRALKAAKDRGLVTGLFSGKTGGRAKGLADFEIIVQSVNPSSARIQECHQFLLHYLCERVERALLEL
jgi:D-sedoheptulose 7-phosphate isomerase